MRRNWNPSEEMAKEYSMTMIRIADFCEKHNIKASLSYDSYYFVIDGVSYRVSNHSIKASNKGAFNSITGEKVRDVYHNEEESGVIQIFAGKTRIIQIYNDLVAGYKLNGKGKRISQT